MNSKTLLGTEILLIHMIGGVLILRLVILKYWPLPESGSYDMWLLQIIGVSLIALSLWFSIAYIVLINIGKVRHGK